MLIELSAERREMITARNGLLGLTLAEAIDDGQLLRAEDSIRGLYLSHDATGGIEEVYRYSGSIKVGTDRAVIEYSLQDHPRWAMLHAEIWNRGNAGSVVITLKDGGTLRDSW